VDDTATKLQGQETATAAPLVASSAWWLTASEVAAEGGDSGLVSLGPQLKASRHYGKIAEVDEHWPTVRTQLVKRLEARAVRAARAARQEAAKACDALGLELSDESRELADAPTITDDNGKPIATAMQGEWHASRARRLSRSLVDVQAECGTRSAKVACGCQELTIPVGCGRPIVCPHCATRKRVRMVKRIRRAVQAHNSAAQYLGHRRGRGRRLAWRLVTFTAAHSGDVERDRKDLAAAFNRWRAWLWNTTGAALPYVLTWEVTNGDDAKGHVHAHAAMRLPWLNLEDAAAAWQRATHGKAEGQGIDFATNRGKPFSTEDVTRYIAKYICKGIGADCEPLLVATWMVVQYGRRAWSASRAFWEVKKDATACPCCGVFWQFAGIGETPAAWFAMPSGAILRQELQHESG